MKTLFMKVISVSLGILGAMLIGELALRLLKYPSSAMYRIDPQTHLRTFTPNSKIFFKGDCFRNTVETNGLGFHSRDYTKEKPPKTYRIVVLGDSFVEAIHVPRNKTFWALLEESLNKSKPHGYDYEVIPFGFSGHGAFMNILYFQAYGRLFHPDLVIKLFVDNDPNDDLPYSRPADRPFQGDHYAPSGSQLIIEKAKNVLRHSVLLTTLRKHAAELAGRLDNVIHPDRKSPRYGLRLYLKEYPPNVAQLWENEEELLNSLCDLVTQQGGKFLLVSATRSWRIHPQIFRSIEKFFEDISEFDFLKPEEVLAAAARRKDFPYLPLTPVFLTRATKEPNARSAWPCDPHWNETGHAWAAEAIADFLNEHPSLISK